MTRVFVIVVDSTKFGMTMSRFVRQFLVASLVAWHAAVMLCGPCLHELAGSRARQWRGLVDSVPTAPRNPAGMPRTVASSAISSRRGNCRLPSPTGRRSSRSTH